MIAVWLIEADVFGESFDALKAEIRRQGMVWEIVQARPFLNGLVPRIGAHQLSENDCVVFSGTYPLMRHIQLHYHWMPGGWCTAENFECAGYYAHFRRHLLNQDHAILGIDEALTQVENLFAQFAREGQVFFRPGGVQKTFTGRCVDRQQFVLALQSARYSRGSVLVAPPREITDEWRLVISRGRVIAASQYRSAGRLQVTPGCRKDVTTYADSLLAEIPWRPDPIFMMDVCRSNGALYLLELNSFSCSGLYQCDPGAVITEVRALAVEAWQQTEKTTSQAG